MISNHFDTSFLWSGENFQIDKDICVLHPSFGNILDLGANCEKDYNTLLSDIVSNPYSYAVELDDDGIDYEKVTPFDVFVWKWESGIELYKKFKEEFDMMKFSPLDFYNKSLSFWFCGGRFSLIKGESEMCFVDMDNPKRLIGKNTFNKAIEFIEKMNMVDDHSHEIHPANKTAKQILLEDMRDEKKRREKNRKNDEKKAEKQTTEGTLASKINAILTSGSGGVSFDNYKNLSVFAINAMFTSVIKKQRYEQVMGGVYAGNVKPESVDETLRIWWSV